jgi:hypothetical protein
LKTAFIGKVTAALAFPVAVAAKIVLKSRKRIRALLARFDTAQPVPVLSCGNRMHGIRQHRTFFGAGFIQRSGERKH